MDPAALLYLHDATLRTEIVMDNTSIYIHDGRARYKVLQWLPQTPRYWNVPAIVALDDGRILYREAPFFLCTRSAEGGCHWCERH